MRSLQSSRFLGGHTILARIARLHLGVTRRDSPRRDDEPDAVPVETPKPRPLAGGAAAELNFED
jgi:hypothetical protein